MDGYTYMIERNKLMIQKARTRELSSPWAAKPTQVEVDTGGQGIEQLMELYSKLEGCGRHQEEPSE